MEDNFSTDRGEDGFRMIQVLYAYWALYFYYYRISCTSDHQALDPETEDPWDIFSGISTPWALCRQGPQGWPHGHIEHVVSQGPERASTWFNALMMLS